MGDASYSAGTEAAVEWSFGHEAVFDAPRPDRGERWTAHRAGATPARDSGLLGPFLARDSLRARSVRNRLDAALDACWAGEALPPQAVLRDGLLALEAGHGLDEAQRTLLLRAALFHRRGIVTALRHQTEPERAAFLIQEALLDERRPLPPAQLWQMLQDEHAAAWAAPLATALRAEMLLAREPRYSLAATALAQMEDELALDSTAVPLVATPSGAAERGAGGLRRRLFVFGLLLVMALALTLGWQHPRLWPQQGALVPAGVYAIGQAGADMRTVEVGAGYAIDRTEVTNRDYHRCVQRDACPPPASEGSVTRRDHFADPAFDLFPVVNVTWEAAAAFCHWSGKRLPTADEWEIAASVAPGTGLTFRYPWGDVYEPRLANGVDSSAGDTQAVALYRPAGDSQFGVSDLAGNAAEWTATPGDNPDTVLVKGGSFRDGQAMLRATAWRAVPRTLAAPWLGFRCAVSMPGD